ncbi:aminoglycoside phosphotransferase family protein [Actinoplanes sp. NBRC 103695]|uniref:phosphotransferase family protein n=1 Tax=Actinoplanes sp. NBRC 103695 TaxID=3032202 RepID=UPI00255516E1|nr:aminoglycoside phosphotransferase family protein [Actinoplanes sp. NBRC 103695]
MFQLPASAVVVRIARAMAYWSDAVNEVNVARWLGDRSFPGAEVLDVLQPIEVGGHPVTFWRFIDGRDGGRDDIGALGAVLRRLHSLPRPTSFNLPSEDILGRVDSRVSNAAVSDEDKRFLRRLVNDLTSRLEGLVFPLAPAPTHGDAHVKNIMIRDSEAVMIDFERFAWGQPEWDLAMTATEYASAGWWSPEEYRTFVDAYGYDVMSWEEGFDVLRRVHELKMTTWLMQNVNESPQISEEFQVRMRTIRGGASETWRAF